MKEKKESKKPINFSQIPPNFIEANLTNYQKDTMEIKYHIYCVIEEREKKIMKAFSQLCNDVNLSKDSVIKHYYQTVKNLKAFYSDTSD